jgi:outer membrane protein assembly factor BamD
MSRIIIFLACISLISLSSCSDYKKLLKSPDLEKKYTEAVKFYEAGQCIKSLQLFEELVTVYKGTQKAESVYYYYAYSNYCVGDYLLASYHFRTFVKNYPTSTHVEECAFMGAYCYYLESPKYTLDQTDTKNAIHELQGFINRFPKSTRIDSCNTLIIQLRGKLEKKAFEVAKQYYAMDDFKAAIVSFENVLKEFPDTKYREEVRFLIVKSTYMLAIKSIESKQPARLLSTIELGEKFVADFPISKYKRDVDYYILHAKKLKDKS